MSDWVLVPTTYDARMVAAGDAVMYGRYGCSFEVWPIFEAMIAAAPAPPSPPPVSLDEVRAILEDWAQRIETDGTPSQVVSSAEVRALLAKLKETAG
jgi:hypothetical protein